MMTRTLRTACLMAATAILLTAVVPPARAGLKLFGKSDETRMGRDVAHQLEKEYGVWDDAEANARIGGIANKITAVANTRGFEMKWKILNTKEVNAVAVPGGYMYVTRGLLELDPRPSDDELAFVIGHETAHISKRHSMDQLEKNLGWAVVIAVVAKGSTAQFVGDLAHQLLASGYSRSDEREADDGGFKYMVDAGYDPRGAVSFMRRLMAMSRGDPLKIFASHPPSKERLQRMQNRLDAMGPRQNYLQPSAAGYELSEAGVAEIKGVALAVGDLGDGITMGEVTPVERAWPVFAQTPTRESLTLHDPPQTVTGLRQSSTAVAGQGAVRAHYIIFDTPEAAHWALLWAVVAQFDAEPYRPVATSEADELWQTPGAAGSIFRKGEFVVALEQGGRPPDEPDRLVTAIARRIAMPAPSLDLVGAPTLLTPDRLLEGDDYVGVRKDAIGLSTDGWRALGVKVAIQGDRVTLSRDGRSVVVRVKSDKAQADGEDIVLKERTWAVDRRVYIPVETVAEKLGLSLIGAPESALVVTLR